MTTVPAAAAATWATEHPTHLDILSGHLVRVGKRTEVDLDRLSETDPPAAAALHLWWSDTRDLWAAAAAESAASRLAQGSGLRLAGRTWVRTERCLVSATQSTAKADKRDLVEEFAALTGPGPLASIVLAATAADPDLKALSATARSLGGKLVCDTDAAASLLLPMVGSIWWPDALGGPAWPGEVARTLTLTLRYAAWRDRRVRRLAGVDVVATELWTDPAHPRYTPQYSATSTSPQTTPVDLS